MSIDIKKELLKQIEIKTKKKVSLSSNLKDIGIDSLELLDQVVNIEKKLNIQINDDDLFGLKTINDVVVLLEKYYK